MPANVQNLAELETLWYTKDEEQWPWEFENKDALVKKVADDIRALFANPTLPYFSFPEVKKLSLNSPEMPVGFLGREEELKTIYEKLNSGGKLMLINAEGGIGKTTLAAKYWNEALNKYKHAAWLFCEGGIVNSLKELAPQLNIDMSGMDEQQQIQAMKQGLAAVQNDFLLVLDNANNEDDIRLFRQEFEGFHWHVLITSRCQGVLSKEQELPITHLPPPLAKELFTRYYQEETEEFEKLLDRVLLAINYHTLLTEVFAKNLAEAAELGEMNLDIFLNKLENEGLYLQEQSFEVENNEWAAKRKLATTDQILDALYDFSQFTEEQRFLMVNIALLPAESYTLPFINSLLVKEPERTKRQIRDILKGLVRKGWISEADRSYRLSPVIQKLVLEKHAETLGEDSKNLLERLNYITETDNYNLIHTSLKDAAPYIQSVHHITQCLKSQPGDKIANYNFNAGIYYANLGDLINAKKTHLNYKGIFGTLLLEEPENSVYKTGLAISYQKLGDIYNATGEEKKALECYQQQLSIFKAIYDSSPENLKYKNGLAISYEKLGDIYIDKGDWKNALTFYQEYNRLIKEIYENSPENLYYKNGLAISHERLGNIYNASGEWKNALAFYQEYNRLIQEIYESSPEDLNYKDGLAISYERLGNIYNATGEWENALTFYREYNRLAKEVYESDPENLNYNDGLAVSYRSLGNIYNAMREWENALDCYQEFNRLIKKVYEISPKNMKYKYSLAISYGDLGDIYNAYRERKNALDCYQELNRLAKEIYENSPESLDYKYVLAISYARLGYARLDNFYNATGERENALDCYQEYNRLTKEIYESSPENLKYKSALAISYYYVGALLYVERDKALAIENINRSLALYKELVEKAPEIVDFSNSYNSVKSYLEELKP